MIINYTFAYNIHVEDPNDFNEHIILKRPQQGKYYPTENIILVNVNDVTIRKNAEIMSLT